MHVKFRQLQRCFGLYFEKVQVTFNSVVKYGHLHLLKFANIQIVLLFVSWSYLITTSCHVRGLVKITEPYLIAF